MVQHHSIHPTPPATPNLHPIHIYTYLHQRCAVPFSPLVLRYHPAREASEQALDAVPVCVCVCVCGWLCFCVYVCVYMCV